MHASINAVASKNPWSSRDRIDATSNSDSATIGIAISSIAVTVSNASNNGGLSSCKSRLYAKGNPLMRTNNVCKAPMTRADLPRVSSSVSGFTFCGMIELPVQNFCGRRMKLNSVVDQRIHSSAQPLKCSAIIVKTKTDSTAKSRSLLMSILLRATSSKPSSFAVKCRSIGMLVPATAAPPSGETLVRFRQSTTRVRSRSNFSM